MRIGLLCALLASVGAHAEETSTVLRTLPPIQQHCVEDVLGEAYPLEACTSFPGALLHWLDSLAALEMAGGTAGKTQPLHRRQFAEAFEGVSSEDQRFIRMFAEVRVAAAVEAPHDMTIVFFDSPDLASAIGRMKDRLSARDHAQLSRALQYFAQRYVRMWNSGTLETTFLERVATDPARKKVGRFLAELREFYRSPASDRTPRLILVPVPGGGGTHAQAIGRDLLIEIRPGDRLADEVPVIVHENAHFLYHDIPAAHRNSWRDAIRKMCEECGVDWSLLREALPTALGQGVATQRYGRRFSRHVPWYHRADVDELAKHIFPYVKRALDEERKLDVSLLLEMLQARTRASRPGKPTNP